MSQDFKTQAEIWQALLDGKKVTHRLFDAAYICLLNGFLVDNDGQKRDPSLYSPQDWSIYNEPKPKKILKPFLCSYKTGITDIRLFESEEKAKAYCDSFVCEYLGPAKGIPDQEIDEV